MKFILDQKSLTELKNKTAMDLIQDIEELIININLRSKFRNLPALKN